MGGPFVQDHADIHISLGLDSLVSFDGDQWVVDRQHFNRPVSSIACIRLTTADLVGEIDDFFEKYVGNNSCAVWFDYTSPGERLSQLHESQSVIRMLSHGDVFKITMNAHIASLGKAPSGSVDDISRYRYRQLEEQLAEFFPSLKGEETMDGQRMAVLLGHSFSIAADSAASPGCVFYPLSAFRYADGQQMVTFCGVVLDRHKVQTYLEQSGLAEWEFKAKSFSDVSQIDVPSLSLREKIEIDRRVFDKSVMEIAEETLIALGPTRVQTEERITMYKRYYRFYPKMARIFAV